MPALAHILLVEDEEALATTMALNLKLENYTVTSAGSGSQALKTFAQTPHVFDLVLLDVMLPDLNGFDLCREFKLMNPGIPVIFLTAKHLVSDKIEGLRLGADDYITKPFDLEELLLRISNLLKRTRKAATHAYAFGTCAVDFSTFEIVDVNGRRISLSKREIGLLELLTSQPNKVVSRDEIIEKLWDKDENASARTIDNYILNFRKHFEKNPREPQHFHSVRGVGYKFTP